LGDPAKREPYGYSHFNAGRGIIAVRNPFIVDKDVDFVLDKTAGMKDKTGEYVVKIIYPYKFVFNKIFRHGDNVKLNIKGYEVVVMEVVPKESLTQPLVWGSRYEIVDKTKYNLYAEPEINTVARIIDVNNPDNNRDVVVGKTADQTKISVGKYTEKLDETGLEGDCTVTVPENYNDTKFIVLAWAKEIFSVPTAKITVNGKTVKPEITSSDTGWSAAGGIRTEHWYWYIVTLNKGDNNIKFNVDKSVAVYDAYIRTEKQLVKQELETVTSSEGYDNIEIPAVQPVDKVNETIVLRK
jgi:hypothetical protein